MPDRDAIELLTDDHNAVKALFKEYEGLEDGAAQRKQELVQTICRELTVHAEIEERIFYPPVRAAGREAKDEVLEGLVEHELIKQLVGELEGMTPAAEDFDARVDVLSEQVEHHVDEEESDMFPRARKALGEERLRDLGRQLEEAKAGAV